MKVLLHTCCAPCSSAILEWVLQNGYEPLVYFFNPNIFPEEEYMRRKGEIVRYAGELGVEMVDEDGVCGDTAEGCGWEEEHRRWNEGACGLAAEPERGRRCLYCFKYRLLRSAQYASTHGLPLFTTTLASSRWKDFSQICEAGRWAASQVEGTEFWDRNWRKGGLYERRNILAKQFYNQQYCGCEYSAQSHSNHYAPSLQIQIHQKICDK